MSAAAAVGTVLLLAVWVRAHLAAPRGRRVPAARRRTRARPPTPHAWAGLLDAIAADVRSGSSLGAACSSATTRIGLKGSLITPGCAPPFAGNPAAPPDEAVVLQALSAAHALGGHVAATLHVAAALLRERAVILAEARTHSAQARLSARVLTAVPVVFATWSLLSSRSFRSAALSHIGLASVAIGAACNVLGWWWMRRIVGRVAA